MVTELLTGFAVECPEFMVEIASGSCWLQISLSTGRLRDPGNHIILLYLARDAIWSGPTIAKLAIVVTALPVLVTWTVRARPRKVQIDAVPQDALPQA